MFVVVTHMDLGTGHDQQLIGIAAKSLCPALDILVESLALLDAGGMGEDHIRSGGAQIAALLRIAGLEDHRLALL
ncbi:hypothetical protein D9M71_697780 [compost metagenome]